MFSYYIMFKLKSLISVKNINFYKIGIHYYTNNFINNNWIKYKKTTS